MRTGKDTNTEDFQGHLFPETGMLLPIIPPDALLRSKEKDDELTLPFSLYSVDRPSDIWYVNTSTPSIRDV